MTRRQQTILAAVLWLVFAAVVWNVIFDRLVVLAGRRYSYDAFVLYHATGRYLLINDVMRPAIAQAVRVASAVAGSIVVAALVLIRIASRRSSEAGRSPRQH